MRTSKRKKSKLVEHDPATGFCVTIGGHLPYVGEFEPALGNPSAEQKLQDRWPSDGVTTRKVVRAVVLTKRDYRRLLKLAQAALSPQEQSPCIRPSK